MVEIQLEAGWRVVEIDEANRATTRRYPELREFLDDNDFHGLTNPNDTGKGGRIFVRTSTAQQMLHTLAHEDIHRMRADASQRNASCSSSWYEVMPEAVAYLVSQCVGSEVPGAAKYIMLHSLYPRWVSAGNRQAYDDYVEENRHAILDAAL